MLSPKSYSPLCRSIQRTVETQRKGRSKVSHRTQLIRGKELYAAGKQVDATDPENLTCNAALDNELQEPRFCGRMNYSHDSTLVIPVVLAPMSGGAVDAGTCGGGLQCGRSQIAGWSVSHEFTRRVQKIEDQILPFPLQNILTRVMRTAAGQQRLAGYLSLWAGTGVAGTRTLPAAELVRSLVRAL
jgi:hypothetical protein